MKCKLLTLTLILVTIILALSACASDEKTEKEGTTPRISENDEGGDMAQDSPTEVLTPKIRGMKFEDESVRQLDYDSGAATFATALESLRNSSDIALSFDGQSVTIPTRALDKYDKFYTSDFLKDAFTLLGVQLLTYSDSSHDYIEVSASAQIIRGFVEYALSQHEPILTLSSLSLDYSSLTSLLVSSLSAAEFITILYSQDEQGLTMQLIGEKDYREFSLSPSDYKHSMGIALNATILHSGNSFDIADVVNSVTKAETMPRGKLTVSCGNIELDVKLKASLDKVEELSAAFSVKGNDFLKIAYDGATYCATLFSQGRAIYAYTGELSIPATVSAIIGEIATVSASSVPTVKLRLNSVALCHSFDVADLIASSRTLNSPKTEELYPITMCAMNANGASTLFTIYHATDSTPIGTHILGKGDMYITVADMYKPNEILAYLVPEGKGAHVVGTDVLYKKVVFGKTVISGNDFDFYISFESSNNSGSENGSSQNSTDNGSTQNKSTTSIFDKLDKMNILLDSDGRLHFGIEANCDTINSLVASELLKLAPETQGDLRAKHIWQSYALPKLNSNYLFSIAYKLGVVKEIERVMIPFLARFDPTFYMVKIYC